MNETLIKEMDEYFASRKPRNSTVLSNLGSINIIKELDEIKEEIEFSIIKPEYSEVYLSNALRFIEDLKQQIKTKR